MIVFERSAPRLEAPDSEHGFIASKKQSPFGRRSSTSNPIQRVAGAMAQGICGETDTYGDSTHVFFCLGTWDLYHKHN